MLIAMLQHAFDPPLAGTVIAAFIAATTQARMQLGAILREQ